MFMTKKREPSYRHYTDEELISLLQFSDNPEVSELVRRFEANVDDHEESITDREKYMVEWATGCFSEHAGEDHHASVSNILHHALDCNKPEMKTEIKKAMQLLEEMDTAAGRMVEAMQSGDAF